MDTAYKNALLLQEQDTLADLSRVEKELGKAGTIDSLHSISEQLIDTLCVKALKGEIGLEQILSDLLIIKINREAVRKYSGATEKLNNVQKELMETQA